MFTSLRSRLWLSYAFVITIALSIVAIVMLIFLIRNPFASREIQQRLRTAQSLIVATPQKFIDNPNSLEEITQTYNCLLYTSPSPRDRQKSRMPSSA